MDTVTLTDSQQIAFTKLKEFVASDNKYFRLTGYAGTGKSFLICQFMHWLRQEKISFIAGSPTNKALKNLERIAAEAGIALEKPKTIAQLLGQQPQLNEDTGKEEFISVNDVSLSEYRLIILDEFSMISKANFNDIVYEIQNSDTKVVFVGDPAQLPPINEKYPVVAKHPYITCEANLAKVVRYDGAIAHVCEQIRTYDYFNKILYPFTTTEDNTITCLKRDDWLAKAVELFKSDAYKANPDYVRFLVWRNRTSTMLSEYVRNELWGKDAPQYVIGDRLIARLPVFRPNHSSHNNKDQWQIIINNSEECEVIGEAVLAKYTNHNWDFWEVPVKTNQGLQVTLRLLTPESEQSREAYLRELKKAKKWNKYYYIIKLFDNVPYAYALTTHKSQGSSINNVFLDIADIKDCPDLQKIIYTALTRVKQQAFIPLM